MIMQKHTHLLFGLGLSIFFIRLFFSGYSIGIQILFCLIGTSMAIVSDWLDFRIANGQYHRNKLTHNVFSPLLIAIFLTGYIIGNWILGVIYCIIFESHILLDSTTLSGVWLGWTSKIRGHWYSHAILPNVGWRVLGVIFLLGGILL